MSKATDDILSIISERGSRLDQADMDRIEALITEIPFDQLDETGMIYEAIALIVNDPLYEGDLDPID